MVKRDVNFLMIWVFRSILLLSFLGFGIGAVCFGGEYKEELGYVACVCVGGIVATVVFQDEIMDLGDDDREKSS